MSEFWLFTQLFHHKHNGISTVSLKVLCYPMNYLTIQWLTRKSQGTLQNRFGGIKVGRKADATPPQGAYDAVFLQMPISGFDSLAIKAERDNTCTSFRLPAR